MKNIYLSEEHETFRAAVRRFVEEEVAPHAEEWEAARRIPRRVFQRLGELGFLGITVPPELGGAGGDLFFALTFLEELPRSRLGGLCAAVSVQQFMATQHILHWGSEALKERYVRPSVAGRLVGALAVTEPDAGSDVASLRTRALNRGDHYLVNGAKTFITNGAEGDFLTLAVSTNPGAGVGGVSLLVVDAGTPGLKVARRLEKMGWHCSDTAELVFEDMKVPTDHLIGEENMGFYYLMEAFQLERLAGAALAVGSAVACLETTLPYLRQRHAFGKPLAAFQALTHRLADLASQVEAARTLTYHAAWLLEQGEPAVKECSMAKLVATELAQRVADACLQCYGGYGTMEEYPISRAFRDARFGTIVAGTSEIMREIVARILVEGETPAPVAQRQPSRPTQPTPSTTPPLPPLPKEEAIPATVEGLMRSLPRRLKPGRTAGWQAVLHFQLKGDDHPLWTVRVEDERCTVAEGLEGTPDCVVEMRGETYVGIETGTVNPQVAFMMRRIKVSDVATMMRFIKSFYPAFQAGQR